MNEMIITVRAFDPCYGFNVIPAGTTLYIREYKFLYRLFDEDMNFVGTCSNLDELL